MPRTPARTGYNDETLRTVVYCMARGGTAQEAAAMAGIARNGRFSDALRTTQFAEMMREAIDDLIATELAPLAIKSLLRLVKDEKQPGRTQNDVAKTILDRAGHVAHDAHKRAGETKELSEMTQEELRSFVERGGALLAAQARDVGKEMVEVKSATPPEAEEPRADPDELFS